MQWWAPKFHLIRWYEGAQHREYGCLCVQWALCRDPTEGFMLHLLFSKMQWEMSWFKSSHTPDQEFPKNHHFHAGCLKNTFLLGGGHTQWCCSRSLLAGGWEWCGTRVRALWALSPPLSFLKFWSELTTGKWQSLSRSFKMKLFRKSTQIRYSVQWCDAAEAAASDPGCWVMWQGWYPHRGDTERFQHLADLGELSKWNSMWVCVCS